MKTYCRFIHLLVLSVLLLGSLPITSPALAASLPPPVPRAFPCYRGALPPPGAICLAIPVYRDADTSAEDAIVIVRYGGRSVRGIATQTVDQPAGTAVAAIDVGPLGANLGDLLTIEIRPNAGNNTMRVLAALAPDPETLTQYLEPIYLDSKRDEAHKDIWGSVYLIDAPEEPLAGVTVELVYQGKVLTHTITVATTTNEPTFEFDASRIPHGATFQLRASDGTRRHSVNVVWSNRQIFVPIDLGWGCIGSPPLHGGGGGMPDSFCLTGVALKDGSPIAGAQVSIAIDGDIIQTETQELDSWVGPRFAAQIGQLVHRHPLDSTLVVTIVKDGYIGTVSKTLQELQVGEAWGAYLEIPLIAERTLGLGMRGGTAGPITYGTQGLYVGSAYGGGVLVQQNNKALWERRSGDSQTALPSPEISTLLALQHNSTEEDWLLAGTRTITLTSMLVASLNSGQAWRPVELPGVSGTVSALAQAPDRSLYVAVGGSLLHLQALTDPLPASLSLADATSQHTLPFAVYALAVDPQGHLFAGATDGLHMSSDAGSTWTLLQTTATPVRALTTTASYVFVGTDSGIFRCAFDGSGWAGAGINGAIFGLASDARGDNLSATTAQGIFSAPGSTLSWTQIAASDAFLTGGKTLGIPDVFDFAPGPDGTLFTATSSGAYRSSDTGQNWTSLQPTLGAVRSIAALNNGDVLVLSAQQLLRQVANSAAWTPVSGLPTTALNGTVVRTSADGQQILVGRGPGPGDSLYASQDGGATWESFNLGNDQGVSAIAFYAQPRAGIAALIATEGDGLFGWLPGAPASIVAFPSLRAAGASDRVGALTISENASACTIIAGTQDTPARTISRPCDTSSPWSNLQTLTTPDGANVGAIAMLAASTNGKLFAATSAGIFQGTLVSGWASTFGLPLRPSAVIVPQNYITRRILVTGGVQSGVLLLNDTAPDIAVQIDAPESVRGGDTTAFRVTVRNQGLLPAASGQVSLTVTFPNGISAPVQTTWNYPTLLMDEENIFSVSAPIPLQARPGMVNAVASATVAPNELYVNNNHTRASTLLDYRSAPDPAITIGGQTMAKAGKPSILVVNLSNLGDQRSTNNTVVLTMPLSATITKIEPPGTTSVGNVITWLTTDSLQSGASQNLRVTYQLPINTPKTAQLPVSAVLTTGGDDRELNNNQSNAVLRLAPGTPNVFVLTNWPRLTRLGPVDAVRAAVNTYIADENGFEIALDSDSVCRVSHLYKEFDRTVAEVAKAASEGNLQAAYRARTALVKGITTCISDIRQKYGSQPTALYIIGGDMVIPSDAIKEDTAGVPALKESDYANTLPQTDTLYSVLVNNNYPSDRVYDGVNLVIGRQPGTPDEIQAVLDAYNENNGTLNITHSTVAGYAAHLTQNTQWAACEHFKERSLPTDELPHCDDVTNSVKAGIVALTRAPQAGSAIVSLSEHGNWHQIGDLTSTFVLTSTLGQVNTMLLLACHSGLAPADAVGMETSLITALAAKGQPSFGYSGFAYASKFDGKNETSLLYAERIHQHLIENLLTGEMSLGQARVEAIDTYQAQMTSTSDPLSTKTLDTFMLYGPPTYRIMLPNGPASTNDDHDHDHDHHPPKHGTFTLIPKYTSKTYASGTLYSATVPNVLATQQVAYGHTVQPAGLVELPSGTKSVRIRNGHYRDIPNTDPIVANVVPLNQPWDYTEPAYIGPSRDWSHIYSLGRERDGTTWLRVGFGQWSPRRNTQRLVDSLTFQTVRESKPRKPRHPDMLDQPRMNDIAACQQTSTQARISTRTDSTIVQAEIVLFDQGQIRVLPMALAQGRWTTTETVPTGSDYLIQLLDDTGLTTLESNGGAYYSVPTTAQACGA